MGRVLLLMCVAACGDPREALFREKFARLDCGESLGHPTDAKIRPSETVSGLTLCRHRPNQVVSGFLTIRGTGSRSVYGDTGDAHVPNALKESSPSCVGAAGDFTASRAYWQQVDEGLRAHRIVTNGQGVLFQCDGNPADPRTAALQLIDWADVDGATEVVDAAMKRFDVCSTVAVQVTAKRCGTFF